MARKRKLTRSPYERIVWFDREVREGKYPNAVHLSEKFEISIRTAYRDIEFLKYNFDAPLAYDATRRGFYYTDKNFVLPAILLTEGELLSLFVGEKVLRQYAGTPYEELLEKAFKKICSALPNPVSVDLSAIADAMSFELGPARPVEVETFQGVLQAIQNHQCLKITYYSIRRNVLTQRLIEPYHLHNFAGDWYVIAHDRKSNEIRDFALSRIRSLTPTAERFSPPTHFNVKEYVQGHFGGFHGKKAHKVVVHFDPYQARWIREKKWQGETGRKEHANGSLTLYLEAPSLEPVLRWVLQFGSHAEVISPKELRDEISKEGSRIAKIYKGK
jgi:predicted DNA-binding transcriptional regulator YafY